MPASVVNSASPTRISYIAAMAAPGGVRLDEDGLVTVLTIDRPDARNAIGRSTMHELATALDDVEASDGAIRVGDVELRLLNEKDPAALPWKDLGVEVVLESTGLFTKRDQAQKHLGQTHARAGHGDTVMRAQCRFQSAAPRCSVERRHDDLGAVLHRGDDVVQTGALGRLAEFADVGAGDEGAATADQHDGVDVGILAESQDAQARVRRILAEMKPREAKLLLLRHSGLSYKELALILNLSPGSVGTLLTQAKRTFARNYYRAFPEEKE